MHNLWRWPIFFYLPVCVALRAEGPSHHKILLLQNDEHLFSNCLICLRRFNTMTWPPLLPQQFMVEIQQVHESHLKPARMWWTLSTSSVLQYTSGMLYYLVQHLSDLTMLISQERKNCKAGLSQGSQVWKNTPLGAFDTRSHDGAVRRRRRAMASCAACGVCGAIGQVSMGPWNYT